MHDGLVGMPPASVAKAITCAYGLDRLGADFRFTTTVQAAGPIENGRLEGDLWLVGGGDPLFGTDELNDLTRQMAEAGLREVTGALRIAAGPLPDVEQIDPDQPPHVGYNPAVGPLNLNFNRVHFDWERQGSDYAVRMDARSETVRPPINRIAMRVEDRGGPVYTYSQSGSGEQWTVARSALGNGGARWLPVRDPGAVCGRGFSSVEPQPWHRVEPGPCGWATADVGAYPCGACGRAAARCFALDDAAFDQHHGGMRGIDGKRGGGREPAQPDGLSRADGALDALGPGRPEPGFRRSFRPG